MRSSILCFMITKNTNTMSNRMNMQEVLPKSFDALLNLSKYAHSTGIQPTHHHLILIRASQINNCAFCLDMHTRDARKAGETEQRIYTLSAWRETDFFTSEECAVLALTEEVTRITNHVSDETYDNAVKVLGEEYTAGVIMATIAINGWNRYAISTMQMPARD